MKKLGSRVAKIGSFQLILTSFGPLIANFASLFSESGSQYGLHDEESMGCIFCCDDSSGTAARFGSCCHS